MTENMVTIEVTNGEFTLEDWQVEAAYRHQLRMYTLLDAKEQARDYLDCHRNWDDAGKPLFEPTEEDYENLVDEFLTGYDCNTDENNQWEQVIIEYFELY